MNEFFWQSLKVDTIVYTIVETEVGRHRKMKGKRETKLMKELGGRPLQVKVVTTLETPLRRVMVYTLDEVRPSSMARVTDFRGRDAKHKAETVAGFLLAEGAINVQVNHTKTTGHYRIYANYPTGKSREILERAKNKFNKWLKERVSDG